MTTVRKIRKTAKPGAGQYVLFDPCLAPQILDRQIPDTAYSMNAHLGRCIDLDLSLPENANVFKIGDNFYRITRLWVDITGEEYDRVDINTAFSGVQQYEPIRVQDKAEFFTLPISNNWTNIFFFRCMSFTSATPSEPRAQARAFIDDGAIKIEMRVNANPWPVFKTYTLTPGSITTGDDPNAFFEGSMTSGGLTAYIAPWKIEKSKTQGHFWNATQQGTLALLYRRFSAGLTDTYTTLGGSDHYDLASHTCTALGMKFFYYTHNGATLTQVTEHEVTTGNNRVKIRNLGGTISSQVDVRHTTLNEYGNWVTTMWGTYNFNFNGLYAGNLTCVDGNLVGTLVYDKHSDSGPDPAPATLSVVHAGEALAGWGKVISIDRTMADYFTPVGYFVKLGFKYPYMVSWTAPTGYTEREGTKISFAGGISGSISAGKIVSGLPALSALECDLLDPDIPTANACSTFLNNVSISTSQLPAAFLGASTFSIAGVNSFTIPSSAFEETSIYNAQSSVIESNTSFAHFGGSIALEVVT